MNIPRKHNGTHELEKFHVSFMEEPRETTTVARKHHGKQHEVLRFHGNRFRGAVMVLYALPYTAFPNGMF